MTVACWASSEVKTARPAHDRVQAVNPSRGKVLFALALAMMDHPNIARVLYAGTTEVGRPCFVMEPERDLSLRV